jgi:two-component system chemotaxis response regulator CheY
MNFDPQAPEGKETRILLIDDNALTRSVLRTILRQDGFQAIREASDAKSGLALARHFAPNLICLDIQMPGKSGLELLAELKSLAPKTPVLMITASNDVKTVKACMAERADGYIIKPFSAETLLKTVAGAITPA